MAGHKADLMWFLFMCQVPPGQHHCSSTRRAVQHAESLMIVGQVVLIKVEQLAGNQLSLSLTIGVSLQS